MSNNYSMNTEQLCHLFKHVTQLGNYIKLLTDKNAKPFFANHVEWRFSRKAVSSPSTPCKTHLLLAALCFNSMTTCTYTFLHSETEFFRKTRQQK